MVTDASRIFERRRGISPFPVSSPGPEFRLRPIRHPPHTAGVTHEHPPQSTAAARWFLAALGVVLILLGGTFVALLGRSYLRAKQERAWPEVPCVILSSEVGEWRHDEFSPVEYRQEIVFGYEFAGERRTGDRLALRKNPWSSNRTEMEERAAELPAGANTTCRVNPADPDFAVLKPDSLAPGYTIWFPGLFVAGGLGMVISAIRGPRKRR